MAEEMLTILNEELCPIGTAPRETAHREGLLHAVVHCWVASRREGKTGLWFQQRARTKRDFPNYYDLAVGGHIGAGESRDEALWREMREEIGLEPTPGCLRYLGFTREELRLGGFFDREVGHVYLYEADCPAFAPGDEVDRMVWVPLEELVRKELEGAEATAAFTETGEPVRIGREEWCVHPGEFEMIVLPALRAAGKDDGE
ncbi:MAG TPA: NUDIX domain-containing protein [Candidatus Merdivicinus intestinavium]|nr:NUDIX domain-containing protein [Candidatus Merdivicinus intestinavium]